MKFVCNAVRSCAIMLTVLFILPGMVKSQSLRFTGANYIYPDNNAQLWSFTTPEVGPPVPYVSFTATPETKKMRLNWSTSNEMNDHRFNIERSVNGTTFKKIGEVAGSVITPTTQDYTLYYTFYDDKPLKGKSFYRLKQVDTDNKIKYSLIAAVKYGDKIKFEILPNPVTGGDINNSFTTKQ